jgi:hypothetical protein
MKLLEDIFFAVYYGLEDLGLDVIWARCPSLAAMCATDEALEHRQVSASRHRWDLQPCSLVFSGSVRASFSRNMGSSSSCGALADVCGEQAIIIGSHAISDYIQRGPDGEDSLPDRLSIAVYNYHMIPDSSSV